jgi:hypothetical protein
MLKQYLGYLRGKATNWLCSAFLSLQKALSLFFSVFLSFSEYEFHFPKLPLNLRKALKSIFEL